MNCFQNPVEVKTTYTQNYELFPFHLSILLAKMLPRRSIRHTTPINPTPTPQFDHAALQAMISSAVATALAHFGESGTFGSGSGTHLANPRRFSRTPKVVFVQGLHELQTQLL